jgi:hypothetical protein
MRTNLKSSIVIAVCGALLLAACQNGGQAVELQEVASQTAGDIRIVLLSESGDLVRGGNGFTLAFRSAADEQPFDAGDVTVSSSMAMPGMAPMVAPIELQGAGEVGRYTVTGDFAMSGEWQFDVRWDGPASQGNTSFRVNVR